MADENQQYDNLIEELARLNGDYKRTLGIVGFQKVLDERFSEDAGFDDDEDGWESIIRNNKSDSDSIVSAIENQYDTPINVNITGDDEDNSNHMPLVKALRETIFKVKLTNAISDIVEPFFTSIQQENEEVDERFQSRHREIFLKLDEVSTNIRNVGKDISESFIKSLQLGLMQFAQHPVMESIRLMSDYIVSPALSKTLGLLFGVNKKDTDTDRIVKAIKDQTELLITGQLDRRENFRQRFRRRGVIGSLAAGARDASLSLVGVNRERFRQDEERRARGESTSGLVSSLSDRLFRSTEVDRTVFGAQRQQPPTVGVSQGINFEQIKDHVFSVRVVESICCLPQAEREEIRDAEENENNNETSGRWTSIVENVIEKLESIKQSTVNFVNGDSTFVEQVKESINKSKESITDVLSKIDEIITSLRDNNLNSNVREENQFEEDQSNIIDLIRLSDDVYGLQEQHLEVSESILAINKKQLREDVKTNRQIFMQRVFSIVNSVKDTLVSILSTVGGIVGGIVTGLGTVLASKFLGGRSPGGKGLPTGGLAAGTAAGTALATMDKDKDTKKPKKGIGGKGLAGIAVGASTALVSSMVDVEEGGRLEALFDILNQAGTGATVGGLGGAAAGAIGGPLAAITGTMGAVAGGIAGTAKGIYDNFDTLVNGAETTREIVSENNETTNNIVEKVNTNNETIETQQSQTETNVDIYSEIKEKLVSIVDYMKDFLSKSLSDIVDFSENNKGIIQNQFDTNSVVEKISTIDTTQINESIRPMVENGITILERINNDVNTFRRSGDLPQDLPIPTDARDYIRDARQTVLSSQNIPETIRNTIFQENSTESIVRNGSDVINSIGMRTESLIGRLKDSLPQSLVDPMNTTQTTETLSNTITERFTNVSESFRDTYESVKDNLTSGMNSVTEKFNSFIDRVESFDRNSVKEQINQIQFPEIPDNIIPENIIKDTIDSLKLNSDKQLEMTSQELQLFKEMKAQLAAVAKNTAMKRQEQVSLGGFDSSTVDNVRGR